MQLEFLSIEISDFKSFSKAQTLSFDSEGLWFVRGRNEVEPRLGANGSGKSTIFGALCWVLYGKTPEGLRNPDLKSWQGNKTPKVTLKLKLDGKPHSITRVATTNGLSIDGQEVGSEEAEKLIGLGFDVFTNTVLLAQGLPLFFDRTPKDKMQLFSDVLQLERWEDRSARASAKVRELETLEAEISGELTGLEAASAQTIELLAKARQQSAEWETERQERVKQFERILKEKEALLEQQSIKLGAADLAYDRAATELKALRKDLPKLAEAGAAVLKRYNDARHELDKLETEVTRLTRELKTLGEADECPTCGQPIKGTGLGKHKAEITRQIAGLEAKVTTAKASVKKLDTLYEEAESVYDRDNAASGVFEKKADEARTTLDRLKPQVAELRAEVLALKSNRTERQEQANPYTEQVQTLRRKQQQLEAQCKELKEDLVKASQQIERTRFWVKGFRDVKLYLIEEVLQELEITTNVMLTEVGLEGWKITYNLEKETKSGTIQRGLNVTITPAYDYVQGPARLGEVGYGMAWRGTAGFGRARQGEEGQSRPSSNPIKWESFSGGEGQRLRIVGALALSQVLLNRAGVEVSLEVLDEPSRHLSIQGANDLCDYLGDRAKQLGKQIFFIDHLTRESSKFAGVVTVVKTDQGSRFEGAP